jgi:CheY-like chemotaxis protein
MGTERTLAGSAAPAGQGRTGLRILVVEDQADTAATLALVLRREGHEVQVAPDGPAAVGAVQIEPPDVILLIGTCACCFARRAVLTFLRQLAGWPRSLLDLPASGNAI